MNFNDYIAEYLGAGIIFTLSLTLCTMDILGILVVPPQIMNTASVLSIASVPGALILLIVIFTSYPVGYLLFVLGLRYMKVLGRESIYLRETQILTYRPYRDVLTMIERESFIGYAGNSDYEKAFSLVRLYLLTYHREIFASLSSYWTRLSRMFCALTSSLILSSTIFMLMGLLESALHSSSLLRPHVFTIAFVLLAGSVVSAISYRLSLSKEIRNFVTVALNLWGTSRDIEIPRYIFAYGSNMLLQRIAERAPTAIVLCTARAAGYRLVFNKLGQDGSAKANIIPSKISNDTVYGVIYKISQADLLALDEAEPNYDRIRILSQTSIGSNIMAYVYCAKPEVTHNDILPYDWYVALVATGARTNRLPESYSGMLSSTPSIRDEDLQRDQKNRQLLLGKAKG